MSEPCPRGFPDTYRETCWIAASTASCERACAGWDYRAGCCRWAERIQELRQRARLQLIGQNRY